MLIMILKMSAVTALFVIMTVLVWTRVKDRALTLAQKLLIGVIFGGFAVVSTHFGVDYVDMRINVRDLGPLCAGLFFDPLSGVLAGLIGGVERYIAGAYWNVGSYTTVACSVSTCLAGILSAFWRIFIFKHKKPSSFYAFFMGAVMEVFHMYAVFITHREDMNRAFYVVRICAWPMIVFSGLGMAASSAALRVAAGEWRNPFRRMRAEETPVSTTFQTWLFVVTLAVLTINILFSNGMQTQSALQTARATLETACGDIRDTYFELRQTEGNIDTLARNTARADAMAIAAAAEHSGGLENVDRAFLMRMRSIYNLVAVTAVDGDGKALVSAGQSPVYGQMFASVLRGSAPSQVGSPSTVRAAAAARCGDGMIQVVVDKNELSRALNLSGLNASLSYFHVGSSGGFEIYRQNGIIVGGDHKGANFTVRDHQRLADRPAGTVFQENLFGVDALCRTERLTDDLTLLAMLPMTEIYASRDAQVYESVLGGILLFAVIYVMISMLVQAIVVNNLELVNDSLHRITGGNLNEVVSVRNSSEFASLSNDINQTVSVLKGYIAAAEKRIEQELELARTIQDSALPKHFNYPDETFEIFATMNPAKEVGGDFYDFFFVRDDVLALVIADVSGKGIPASLFMMRAKTTLRGLAESGREPNEILYRANNTLCDGNDAEMFVTVWLGILDLCTGVMKCANAGHEYPVLMRAGGDYELVRDKHGLALAAMEGMPFKSYELQLNPGDRLFVYTDGVPEAINGETEQYGVNRLLDRLNARKDASMRALLPDIRRDIADFAAGEEQFDDITMLGFVYNGPGKHAREP